MSKVYYTLFTREDDGKWYPQFGDYDRKTVIEEMREYRNEYKAKDIRVVQVLDDMSAETLIEIANSPMGI